MNTVPQPVPTVNHFLQIRPFATFTDDDRPTVDGYFVEEVDNDRRVVTAHNWQDGHRHASPFTALDAARRIAQAKGLPVVAPLALRDAYYSQAVAI